VSEAARRLEWARAWVKRCGDESSSDTEYIAAMNALAQAEVDAGRGGDRLVRGAGEPKPPADCRPVPAVSDETPAPEPPPPCERCGAVDGEVGPCPFDAEMNGGTEDCPSNCCSGCRYQCAMDI
jgi:hypothetical protein